MKEDRSIEIKLKRIAAIETIKKESQKWDINLYTAYDFQLDMIIRDSCGFSPRNLGKPPYDYIELTELQ